MCLGSNELVFEMAADIGSDSMPSFRQLSADWYDAPAQNLRSAMQQSSQAGMASMITSSGTLNDQDSLEQASPQDVEQLLLDKWH